MGECKRALLPPPFKQPISCQSKSKKKKFERRRKNIKSKRIHFKSIRCHGRNCRYTGGDENWKVEMTGVIIDDESLDPKKNHVENEGELAKIFVSAPIGDRGCSGRAGGV